MASRKNRRGDTGPAYFRYSPTLATSSDGIIYITGGAARPYREKLTPARVHESAEAWDAKTNRWREIAPMHHPRDQHAAAVDRKGRLFVFGGSPENGGARGSEHEVQDLALIDPHPRSALALSIRAFVIEPYRIPSGSMLPTLLIGDHLFVNKFLYGIKIPFTDWRTPGLRAPQRGDVVVFTIGKDGRGIHPADQRPDLPHDQFVKRLVGLPGDTIEVRSGDRYVNGKAMETKDTGADFRDDAGRTLRIANETLDPMPVSSPDSFVRSTP